MPMSCCHYCQLPTITSAPSSAPPLFQLLFLLSFLSNMLLAVQQRIQPPPLTDIQSEGGGGTMAMATMVLTMPPPPHSSSAVSIIGGEHFQRNIQLLTANSDSAQEEEAEEEKKDNHGLVANVSNNKANGISRIGAGGLSIGSRAHHHGQQQLFFFLPPLYRSNPVLAALAALLVLALILATALGNLMVCLAIGLVRKLKAQPANLLLISLAVADFCVGLFVMPMAAADLLLQGRWVFGEFLCRFWVTADLTLCTASILNLCMISVDRHLAVTRALRYSASRTRRRICVYICLVWLGALLVSAAPLALLPFPETLDKCQVTQNRYYQIYATILSFWLPSLTMVIVYVKMWSAAKRMQRQDEMVLRWQGLNLSEPDEARRTSTGGGGGGLHGQQHNGTAFPGLGHHNSALVRANAHFLFALRRSAQKFRQQREETKSINNNNNSNSIGQLAGGTPMAEANGNRNNNNSNNNNNKSLANGSGAGGRASAVSALIRIPLLGQPKPHEDKARKTLGVIMSVFLICWVPFFILALLKSQTGLNVPHWLDTLVLWLGYSNSMLNPLIYCKYNREFRIPFGEMLCCRFGTIQDVMRNESYYTKFGSPRMGNEPPSSRSAKGEFKKEPQSQRETLAERRKECAGKRNSSPCCQLLNRS